MSPSSSSSFPSIDHLQHTHSLSFICVSSQGFLKRTDEHILELQDEVKRKDEEIVFLRSMLASLSEKVDHLEKTAVGKLGKRYIIHMYVYNNIHM